MNAAAETAWMPKGSQREGDDRLVGRPRGNDRVHVPSQRPGSNRGAEAHEFVRIIFVHDRGRLGVIRCACELCPRVGDGRRHRDT